MANVNKVILIGRLTRDPEARTFANGGKVLNFGLAVSNRKKNSTTGQWEDDPMFIDVKIFNRGEMGKQADIAEQSLRKGHQVFLEGKLVLEQWEDKNGGGKRSKHTILVDNFQFLEPRQDGGGEGGGARYQQSSSPPQRRQNTPTSAPPADHGYDDDGGNSSPPEDIPF